MPTDICSFALRFREITYAKGFVFPRGFLPNSLLEAEDGLFTSINSRLINKFLTVSSATCNFVFYLKKLERMMLCKFDSVAFFNAVDYCSYSIMNVDC